MKKAHFFSAANDSRINENEENIFPRAENHPSCSQRQSKSLKPVSFASRLEKAHLYHLLSSGRRASSHSVHVQFPGSEVAWRPRPTGLNSVRWRTRLGKGVVSQTNGGKNPNSRGGNRTARSTVETQTNGTSLPQFVRIVMRKPN